MNGETTRQERHQCGECRREWVRARVPVPGDSWREWVLGDQCPACGSSDVTLVAYTPVFPGADIATPPDVLHQALSAPTAPPHLATSTAPNEALLGLS